MGKNLSLKIYPDQILRQKARDLLPSELVSQETKELILAMGETMRENNGVGLAAPSRG